LTNIVCVFHGEGRKGENFQNTSPNTTFDMKRSIEKTAETEEEEEDYLSMDLSALESSPKRKQKRTSTSASLAPLRVREQQQREQGLSKALDEQNKGFQMLQKLGYRQVIHSMQ
jgi:hypothetical protein